MSFFLRKFICEKLAELEQGNFRTVNTDSFLNLSAKEPLRNLLMHQEDIEDSKDSKEHFFDLSSSVTSEVLQKERNYGPRMTNLGGFSAYPSSSLQAYRWSHRARLLLGVVLGVVFSTLSFSSCVSGNFNFGYEEWASRSGEIHEGHRVSVIDGPNAEVRSRLVEEAMKVLGARRLKAKGKNFLIDCTGVVQAIYWSAGIDLTAPLRNYSGNGVARLYAYLEEMELLKGGSDPLPGDLIFFDNTYDRNGNGKVDDPLTHVGMVVSINDKGNLEYIHHNYRKGIILEKMNPREPSVYSRVENGETVIVNSPMRMRGSPEYDKTLSGELVRSWGEAWRLRD